MSRSPVAGPHLTEPVRAALRLEVGTFRQAERRRRFPVAVHVGHAAGPRVTHETPASPRERYDAGLRFQVVDALVDRWRGEHGGSGAGAAHPPGVQAWVTRPGVPALHDEDVGWFAEAAAALGAHGLPLAGFWAVTRTGWLDVRTGESRTWSRLRL